MAAPLALLVLLLFTQGLHAASILTAIVSDPLTGVAIDGYDPVSYFTEKEPLVGKPDFELVWAGVPWHFASAANRDAFARAPEIYAPRYGGHCAMAMARGYLSDGNPRIYALKDQRLYLFYSGANRDAFLLSPYAALGESERRWPELSKTFTRN